MAKKRKRGPILVKPGSDEAKRIEDTHGFDAALKARDKRAADADPSAKSENSATGKGDKS